MSDLVVVSNRGPATVAIADDGALEVRHAAGGLAPSLLQALEGVESLWVASAMSEGERKAAREGLPAELATGTDLRLVDAPSEIREAAYRVVANSTLWFLSHGLFDLSRRPSFDRHWHLAWERYREFNRLFAEEVAERAGEGGTVMVNDYHLFLAGRYLADLRPDLRTVHFTHTPFPTPEELNVLPRAVAAELVLGMSSYGACGFHTDRWADHFLRCADRVVAHPPAVFAAPLGTDADDLRSVAASPACQQAGRELAELVGDRKLIFRADRIELSKNILRGFLAFEELLETCPQWRGRVVFVARAYPSRQDLPDYLAYRSEAEHLAERINERFASADAPAVVLEVHDDFPASVAALKAYDVLLVNPVRDGMNLVAKEGPVVNANDGVLALSREAGAFADLEGPALEVEPFDVSGTAAVLLQALEMPPDERAARAAALRERSAGHSPASWFQDVIAEARAPNPPPLR